MEFRVPGFNVEMQHNQMYHTSSASTSFNYSNFLDQPMRGGPMCLKEAIQRELEKEMIREKIIAEEVERFHALEAQVRRDLMIRREMTAMKGGVGMGFPSSSFMLGPQPAEIRHTTGNLNALIFLPKGKRKTPPPPPLPAAGSSSTSAEHNSCNLKKKMKWSAPCESGLQDYLAGKKHDESKVAALKAVNTEKVMKSVENSSECIQNEDKKKSPDVAGSMELLKNKVKWGCSICKVSSTSEIDLQNHLVGKKHKAKEAIIRKGKDI